MYEVYELTVDAINDRMHQTVVMGKYQFSKNGRKNSKKFPSNCLKICTKVFHISPQISIKLKKKNKKGF